MKIKILLALSTLLPLVSCIQSEREICMISTADPTMAKVISEKNFRASLASAKGGNLKAIDTVIAYYLDKGMTDKVELWERRREIAVAKTQVKRTSR